MCFVYGIVRHYEIQMKLMYAHKVFCEMFKQHIRWTTDMHKYRKSKDITNKKKSWSLYNIIDHACDILRLV